METDERPWGRWIKFADNERCTIKILEIRPGEAISFQSHEMRDELWHLLTGNVRLHLGPKRDTWEEIERELEQSELGPGDSVSITKNTVHCAENTGTDVCRILEVSTGEFREDDIKRWKDRYGRC